MLSPKDKMHLITSILNMKTDLAISLP